MFPLSFVAFWLELWCACLYFSCCWKSGGRWSAAAQCAVRWAASHLAVGRQDTSWTPSPRRRWEAKGARPRHQQRGRRRRRNKQPVQILSRRASGRAPKVRKTFQAGLLTNYVCRSRGRAMCKAVVYAGPAVTHRMLSRIMFSFFWLSS